VTSDRKCSRRRTRRLPAAAAGLAAMVALASCSTAAVSKSTATFAEQPGAKPDYILPLTSFRYFSIGNVNEFQYLMFRPLYWFTNQGRVTLNDSLSLANPPQYAPDGKSVTVTLKSYYWSDGQPVTTRDIEFWQNLVTANKADWAAYIPGEYPDNVTGVTVNSASSITFHLSQAYGSSYFTYNELSQITPLPQHMWDKESALGPIGDYDMNTTGAQAVYKFLDSQSASVQTYSTNPLWQVVDGPWRLKSLDASGNVKFVPNTMYSGPVKPKLSEFDELGFANDAAEFKALQSTSSPIDVGYLPFQDVPQRGQLATLGYRLEPWADFGITFLPENYTNPTSGPIFKQLYFRQAMQDLVDQQTFIKRAYSGYAYPTHGPVPLMPTTGFVDSTEKSNQYAYSVDNAVSLLKSHGWTVKPGGVSTCTSPGAGAAQCGPGVPAGAQASFHLEYDSNAPALDIEMSQLKTDFALAGIQLNLSTAPFASVIGDATPCAAGQPCKWDMEFWGGGWTYTPDFYPTGDELWATGVGANSNGYTDPMMDKLIMTTETTADASALYSYEDYAATQLPVIWMPTPYYQLAEINRHLQGIDPPDPELNLLPENWSWS
jgi:peptide/nickel transport system substrate-binding protein